MKVIIDNDKCCGCMACVDSCPVNAIAIKEERGFFFPRIDENKCVGCGKCEKVCPVNRPVENAEYDDYEPVVWAAWNSSEEQLRNSTSGGLFVAFAERFIADGGYVCGCAFSDDYKSCYHTVTNDTKQIPALMHSKYFQSNTEGVYRKILELLKQGERVLFCGTPCQTAAVHNFVGEKWRDNLLLVDLFCKGVPSPVVHAKYVASLEKKAHSKIVYFRSKSKVKGWGKFFTELKFENGKQKFVRSPLDNLFVTQALNVRSACASCAYKGLDRVADISIGDYWGITGIDKGIVRKGVSAMLVSTQKGNAFIESVGDAIVKEKRSVFDVSNKHNLGFSKKIVLGEKHKSFFDDVETIPFDKVIKKYALNNSLPVLLWRKAKWVLSKLKGISFTKFIYINFLCRHVQRGKGAYIIPGPNTIFEFQKGSKLVLEKGKALINFRKPKDSKAEAWIQLNENATMIIREGLDIRNCRFIVQRGAVLDIGEMEMNGQCNIVARQKITIGKGVMVARDVTIYDSDYHPFSLVDDIQTIATKPVHIKDHVWVGNGATIMKGVTVGEGAVISAKSVVIKNVKPKSMVSGNPATQTWHDIYWAK